MDGSILLILILEMTDCTAVDETSIKLLKGGAICIGGSAGRLRGHDVCPDGVNLCLEKILEAIALLRMGFRRA